MEPLVQSLGTALLVTATDIKVTRQKLAEPSDENVTMPDLQQLPIQDLNDRLTLRSTKNSGE